MIIALMKGRIAINVNSTITKCGLFILSLTWLLTANSQNLMYGLKPNSSETQFSLVSLDPTSCNADTIGVVPLTNLSSSWYVRGGATDCNELYLPAFDNNDNAGVLSLDLTSGSETFIYPIAANGPFQILEIEVDPVANKLYVIATGGINGGCQLCSIDRTTGNLEVITQLPNDVCDFNSVDNRSTMDVLNKKFYTMNLSSNLELIEVDIQSGSSSPLMNNSFSDSLYLLYNIFYDHNEGKLIGLGTSNTLGRVLLSYDINSQNKELIHNLNDSQTIAYCAYDESSKMYVITYLENPNYNEVIDAQSGNLTASCIYGYSEFPMSFSSCSLLGVGEQNQKDALSIYPNPTTNRFYIKNATGYSEVLISDLSGKLFKKLSLVDSDIIELIDVPSGYYFLTLYGENLTPIKRKIVKL